MKCRKFRKFIAALVRAFGTLASIYIGVYQLLIKNLIHFFGQLSEGSVTPAVAVSTGLQVLVSLTLGGAIWVLCDILAAKIQGYD